jgi:hypothetical protein
MGDMVKASPTPYVSEFEQCKKWVVDYIDLNFHTDYELDITKFDYG